MSKGGFTLLELLAATAIAAVALLLISIAGWKVYQSSSLAVSANNIRQLAVGTAGYLADHNQTFWRYRETVPKVGVRWWFGLETAASLGQSEGHRHFDPREGPLGDYVPRSLRPDPSFLFTGRALKPKYDSGYLGIGYNVLLADAGANRLKAWAGTGQPLRYWQLKRPAQVVVFATSAQVNTFQSPASASHPMIEEFYGIDDMETTVHFRHGETAMVGFADGSAGFLPVDKSTIDSRAPKARVGRFAPQGSKKYLQ